MKNQVNRTLSCQWVGETGWSMKNQEKGTLSCQWVGRLVKVWRPRSIELWPASESAGWLNYEGEGNYRVCSASEYAAMKIQVRRTLSCQWVCRLGEVWRPDEGNFELPVSQQAGWSITPSISTRALPSTTGHGRNTGGGRSQRQSPKPFGDSGADGQYLGAFWAALILTGVYLQWCHIPGWANWCVQQHHSGVPKCGG